jgi:acyl-CoA thioesterase-1
MSETAPGQPTPRRRHPAAALLLIGLAAAAPILVSPRGHGAGAAIDRCAVPIGISDLRGKLPHTAARLALGLPVTIVALGSSSTEGIGASRPDRSYPSRLEALLRAEFPGAAIRVVNRGVGGELAPQMAARLEREVLAEKPDLVIWQLGTNSVLRDIDPTVDGAVAESGIARIKAAGAEVMLMDLQYAPAVLLHPGYRDMLQMLSSIARSEDVPIVHRFAMMRHWAEDGQMTLQTMLAADRLHMSDASYDCLARQVARSIVPPTGEQSAFLVSGR